MLNSRALIKRASQLGARQASHKETHTGGEVGDTRCVFVCETNHRCPQSKGKTEWKENILAVCMCT